MRDAWKANQDGKGEEREKKKNATSRQGRQKATVNIVLLGVFHSDLENNKCLEIQDPSFQSDKVRKLLLSMDKVHNTHKKRNGNPRYTTIKYMYVKSNVPVPALTKTEGKVPLWVVPEEWLNDNPKLEKVSRGNIDYKRNQMPHVDKVNKYLHIYKADEQEYIDGEESDPELGTVPIEAHGNSTFTPNESLAPASPLFQAPLSATVPVYALARPTGANIPMLPIKPKAPPHAEPTHGSCPTLPIFGKLQWEPQAFEVYVIETKTKTETETEIEIETEAEVEIEIEIEIEIETGIETETETET
ncbi:hypothetical protein RSAG8_12818, partial [Rhizoctonia solani AG-8 WAC10335]